jgi:HPt (histidine-containing phosphotransfer) domain-containing protein
MDVQMPEMDGLAATAAIRETEKGSDRHRPIIGVTAHAMKGDRERCLASGMDGYVSKPIRPAALFAAIHELVGKEPRAAEPAAAPVDGAAVLDEAGLLTLVGGDNGLLRELAGLFLEDSPLRLAEIESALEGSDRESLERAAHTLKGSAASLGGARTADVALRLEKLAQEGDFTQARAAFPLLGDEVGKLQRALSRLAGRGAS